MDASDLDPAVDYIFTIGHSNTPLDVLLANLRAYSIEALVDVRSQPLSRFAPRFNRHALEQTMPTVNVQYLFMGDRLGGRPSDASLYDAEGHVRYDLWSVHARFRSGIGEVLALARHSRVALMCSEEEPRGCHRHLLVARVLQERAFAADSILHIRKDRSCESEASLPRQGGLIQPPWRSPVALRHKMPRRRRLPVLD